MALLKLVYFAHGWYLALKNEPLLNERIQAWRYGPVVPSLYHEFKDFGNEPITRLAKNWQLRDGKICMVTPELTDEEAKKLVRRVWDVYKGLTAVQLSNLTHVADSPWASTPHKEIMGTTISDETIKNYFAQLAEQNQNRAQNTR